MQTHIIENGNVTNTIMATVSEAQSAFPQATCIEAITGGIGWTWDGTTLTAPPTPPAPIPQSVTMRQAELALLDADLLDDIEALTPMLPRSDQISWKRASVVERSNPLVAYVQQTKGLTDAQIDALFVQAATL